MPAGWPRCGLLLALPAFAFLIFSAPLHSVPLFQSGACLLGFGTGLFSVGTLVTAMSYQDKEFVGLGLGAWGAVHATAGGVAAILAACRATPSGSGPRKVPWARPWTAWPRVTALFFTARCIWYLPPWWHWDLWWVACGADRGMHQGRFVSVWRSENMETTSTETGAITQYVDVAQLVLYVFGLLCRLDLLPLARKPPRGLPYGWPVATPARIQMARRQ
jgi:hypothetical protein